MHQDLRLHVALGVSLMAVKGRRPRRWNASTRARALCQQVGDTPQLFPVLRGLFLFYLNRGQQRTAQELAEQLLRQAERQPEVAPRMLGHYFLGQALFSRGPWGMPCGTLRRPLPPITSRSIARSRTSTASTSVSLPGA